MIGSDWPVCTLAGSYETVMGVVIDYAGRLASLPAADALKDSKTRLQELLQSRGEPLPTYTLEEVSGEPHDQWFVANCEVLSQNLRCVGEGSSRRRAEQEAAQKALESLSLNSGEQSAGQKRSRAMNRGTDADSRRWWDGRMSASRPC